MTVTPTGSGPTGYEVTFRYAAEDAETVGLVGDAYFTDPEALTAQMDHEAKLGDHWEPGDVSATLMWAPPAAMTEVRDGIWELTTAMPAGVYSYGFVVGECAAAALCQSVYDPANPPLLADAETASIQSLSQVYVPESPDFPTDDASALAPVSAESTGSVSVLTYAGQDGGDDHRLAVYLPADYDAGREQPYPLIVLSHGVGGDETSWFTRGAAAAILDSAIASGDMPASVVVATNFYDISDSAVGTDEFFDDYRDELIETVFPLVEEAYHVSTEPSERAFAGLSMGGAIALDVAMSDAGAFGYVAAWSAAADLQAGVVAAPDGAEGEALRSLIALHLGTGRQDLLGDIASLSQQRAEQFRAAGIPVTEVNVDGGHTWQVWQDLLEHFVTSTAFQ